MSKASEWAAMRYDLTQRHATEAGAVPAPHFAPLNIVGDQPLQAQVVSWSGDPAIEIDYEAPWSDGPVTIRMDAERALALARWILDTFGEEAPHANP